MDIAIIGKGTSAIITALKCIQRGHKVTIYSDPNTPHLSVGESTTPIIKDLLYYVLNINIHEMCSNDITSLKTGVKFINWGKGNDFYHFFINDIAFHFDTSKFNPFIHNVLKTNNIVSYIEKRVDTYTIENDSIVINYKSYDFAVFCSGWEDNNEYYKPVFETVNSALLYTEDFVDRDSTCTIHRATEDGWQFGLPFPKSNSTRCGYLYDRNISSTEEIKTKMGHLNSQKNIEWDPKYAKKLIQNNYCAYNGNKLFFLEPLQALSLHYYEFFANMICDYLSERSINSFYRINNDYAREIMHYQLSLAYHYKHGSIHNTDFWKNVVKNSNNMFHFHPFKDENFHKESLVADFVTKNTKYSNVGEFYKNDISQLHCGFTQEKIEDIYRENLNNLKSFSL